MHSREEPGAWLAMRRPAFVLLVQGVAIAMVATGTVAAPLVLSVALCWTTAVAVQLMAALLVIRAGRSRSVSTASALDLFFMGHAPWSLWILGNAALVSWAPAASGWITLASTIVAAALTARIVTAFASVVLGASRRQAIGLAALHQTVIWAVLLGCAAAAIQLRARLGGALI